MSENKDTFNSFSVAPSQFSTRDFLESNSIIAKFAFLLLVIIMFLFLLKIFTHLLGNIFKPNHSPKLINGMVDATQMIVYPQDPSMNNAVTVYRSVDAKDGIEFSWSVWIFIENLQTNAGIYKHIFSKGNSNLATNGLVEPNNAPGLYIAPNTNTLVVIMNTYHVINEEILIPDIPMNKWVNVVIRCKGQQLDVYINGTLTRSLQLMGVPKQNYGEVYVAMNGGFSGYISNLWYYNYALGARAIQNLVSSGPNTKMIGSNSLSHSIYNYLSLRWYFTGANDAYNP
jgi:hypothetical protein